MALSSKLDHSVYWITFVCSLLLVVRLITIGQRQLRLRHIGIKNGCLAGNRYNHKDPYSGIGLISRVVKAYQSRNVLQLWQEFSHKYGHTFTFWILGNRNFVTSEPENVRTILASSFEIFDHGPSRRYGYEPLLGDGIFAADGAKWSEARALLRPSFAKSRIFDVEMFERHFQAALKALPADAGVVVDLQELFKRLSMDLITDMLFGSSTSTLTQTESDERSIMTFSHACEYSQKVVWRKIALGWIGTLWPDREDRRSRRLLHQTVDQWVWRIIRQGSLPQEKQKDPNQDRKHSVFLENLAQRTQDPKVLRDQLLSALLGGRDTTSSLLSQLFHTLARRPDIWQKLRSEAKSLGPGPLTQESMRNAKFARQCLQECKLSPFTSVVLPFHRLPFVRSSSPPTPRSTHKPALGQRRHSPPPWWRSQPNLTTVDPARHKRLHKHLRDAPTTRHLGR